MGESPINLGRLIKNARLEAGLTQDNLATHVETVVLMERQFGTRDIVG